MTLELMALLISLPLSPAYAYIMNLLSRQSLFKSVLPLTSSKELDLKQLEDIKTVKNMK